MYDLGCWSGDPSGSFLGGDSREFSPPRRVFAIGGASGDGAHPLSLNRLRILYAVKADGQRFLVNLPVGQDTSSPITVVLNWTAGLKKWTSSSQLHFFPDFDLQRANDFPEPCEARPLIIRRLVVLDLLFVQP